MKYDFSSVPETVLMNFKGGKKAVRANIFYDGQCRVMLGSLEPGASIGRHRHEDTCEVIYILAGRAKAQVDGEGEELLEAGQVHYCPKGREHSLENVGNEDLRILAVVC